MSYLIPDPLFMLSLGLPLAVSALALTALLFADLRREYVLHPAFLKQRLMRSRMSRMLRLRDVDPEHYLEQTDASSVRLHLLLCRNCDAKRKCDAAVRHGGADDYGFCVNGPVMERLSGKSTWRNNAGFPCL